MSLFGEKIPQAISRTIESIIEDYAECFTIAIVLATIIYNIFLIAKIKYGEIVITKLTLLPYYFSFVFLVLMAANEVIEELISQKKIVDGKHKILITTEGLRRMWLICYWLRCIAFECFFGIRILEDVVLNFYVDWQNHYKLEEL